VALLRKMICNLRHPISLRHPIRCASLLGALYWSLICTWSWCARERWRRGEFFAYIQPYIKKTQTESEGRIEQERERERTRKKERACNTHTHRHTHTPHVHTHTQTYTHTYTRTHTQEVLEHIGTSYVKMRYVCAFLCFLATSLLIN